MNRDMMARLAEMQERLQRAQEEIENRVARATAGGGAVWVEISGGFRVKSIKIDPAAVDPDDLGMLEDLIVAAMNEGLQQVQAFQSENLAGLTSGLNLPGLGGSQSQAGGGVPLNRAARRASKR